MSIEAIIEFAWAPLIVFAVSLLYGIQLLATKNPKSIRGKSRDLLRNEEEYAKGAGKLLLFLAAGAMVMVVLLFINVKLAVLVVVFWAVAFGILWKRMNNKYGTLS